MELICPGCEAVYVESPEEPCSGCSGTNRKLVAEHGVGCDRASVTFIHHRALEGISCEFRLWS